MNTIEHIYIKKACEKSDINEHLPTLRYYASKCDHVTEFGVRGIVSTWALLAARPKCLVSVDIVKPDLSEILGIANEIGVRFQFIHGDTRKIDIEPTDMLFIDTLHTEEQMRIELDRHSGQVRKFIAMHDTFFYGENGELPDTKGILVAIREFLDQNKDQWKIDFKTDDNNGLMALKRVQ